MSIMSRTLTGTRGRPGLWRSVSQMRKQALAPGQSQDPAALGFCTSKKGNPCLKPFHEPCPAPLPHLPSLLPPRWPPTLSSLRAFALAVSSFWNTLPPSSTQLETFMQPQEPEKTMGAGSGGASRASRATWTSGSQPRTSSLCVHDVRSCVTAFKNVFN